MSVGFWEIIALLVVLAGAGLVIGLVAWGIYALVSRVTRER